MGLATVRTFISDSPQYVSADAVGDDFTTEFVFPYSPISSLKVYMNGLLQGSGYTHDDSLGLVTFAQPPASGVAISFSAQTTLLSDAQINSILALYPDSDDGDATKLASADCLEIIASSEVMIQKKIKMLDLEVDGPALAKSLQDHARALREAVLDPMESSFDFAEQINDKPGFREKVVKDWMRNFA